MSVVSFQWRPRSWRVPDAGPTVEAVKGQQERVLEASVQARTATAILVRATREFVESDTGVLRDVAAHRT